MGSCARKVLRDAPLLGLDDRALQDERPAPAAPRDIKPGQAEAHDLDRRERPRPREERALPAGTARGRKAETRGWRIGANAPARSRSRPEKTHAEGPPKSAT